MRSRKNDFFQKQTTNETVSPDRVTVTRFGTGNTVFYVALLNHGWNHQFFSSVRLNLGWGHHKDPVIHNVITLVTLGYLFYVLSCSLVTSRMKSDDARPFDKKMIFSQYWDFSLYQHITCCIWLDMTGKLVLVNPCNFEEYVGEHFKIAVQICPSQGPKFHGQFDIMHELISKCIQIQL